MGGGDVLFPRAHRGVGFLPDPFFPWPESPGFPSFVRSGFLTSVGRNLWFRDSEIVMTISTRATSAQGALPSPEEHRQYPPVYRVYTKKETKHQDTEGYRGIQTKDSYGIQIQILL